MNTTINIKNKLFKKCHIILVRTNNSSIIHLRNDLLTSTNTNYNKGKLELFNPSLIETDKAFKFYQKQHLYIVSDVIVKKNDYTIYLDKVIKIIDKDINCVIGEFENGNKISIHKDDIECKIIISTNSNLNLPSPSYDFIKSYCNKEFNDIYVEYINENTLKFPTSIRPYKISWNKE